MESIMASQKKNLFKKGTYIYIEGDDDIDSVYVIEEGSIGFILSLSNQPRIESAFTLSDARVAELLKSGFLAILDKNPDLAIKIINYIADELRSCENLMFDTGTGTHYEAGDIRFYKPGEYYFEEKSYQLAHSILLRFLRFYPDSGLKGQVRAIIDKIDNAGLKTVTEPVKRGLTLEYSNDRIIFREYEPGEEFSIIREGKVKIVKYQNNNEIMLCPMFSSSGSMSCLI